MNNYRYVLDKSSKKHYCPLCKKKRFVRYIDNHTNNYLSDEFGRCDREQSCGYHTDPYKDRSSFITHSKMNVNTPKPLPKRFIPYELFSKCQTNYHKNNFVKYLHTLFDEEMVNSLVTTYKIGTSKHWNGATVFWQIDRKYRIRTGRIFLYDPKTCRRDKNKNHWVHSLLYKSYKLKQCYFGEYLLKSDKPVAVVESAKTAIIASAYLPDFIWIATDGSNGLMPSTHNKHEALQGRKVSLFPDAGKFNDWSKKAARLQSICKVNVSSLIEHHHEGYDLADYLIQFDIKSFTNKGMGHFKKISKPQRKYPSSWDEVTLSEDDPEYAEYARIFARESDDEIARAGMADPILKTIMETFECEMYDISDKKHTGKKLL